jgi:hypothetical protein
MPPLAAAIIFAKIFHFVTIDAPIRAIDYFYFA